MSRTVFRLFSSSLRASARANLTVASRSHRAALARRMMSSESHASRGSTSSDRSWIIGSALLFGPVFLYLVSPAARKGSHGHDSTNHGRNTHHDGHREDEHAQPAEPHREEVQPATDDEDTEVSGQEVKESMEKAFEADSPKDTQEREEVVAKAETTANENNSVPEVHAEAESRTDAIPALESGLNPAPMVTLEVIPKVTDVKVRGTVEGSELAPESKA